jgi:aspartokinase
LKDNKSISESILQEIEEEKINLEKIISSKKDLIIYLDIKKSQIRKLDIRLKSQENGKDDFLKKLQLEIESLKLELEKLKDNYDDMFSFPKIQDNIKIEMDIIQENIFSKEKELEEKKISELLSKTLSEKTEAM